ncbi:MAG: ABC-ATPase UvrA [Deltaproteobacteria bacterium]|nr:ABC-ATPase UvrA [Deltaproteobacteria bacterium]
MALELDGTSFIRVRGARVHNLRGVDVDIPKGQLTVVTGVSGSGKSSLAFDTIFAEAERRYLEALSPFARHFIPMRDRPEVDAILGLSPAIAIQHRTRFGASQGTVATATGVHDFLRFLFAHAGVARCTTCGTEIRASSVHAAVARVLTWPAETRVAILAPALSDAASIATLRKSGFVRIRVDGQPRALDDDAPIGGDVAVYVDRLTLGPGTEQRIAESIETAYRVGNGVALVERVDERATETFTETAICRTCNIRFPPITPRLFSFTAPDGACPTCAGRGALAETRDDDGDDANDAANRCETCDGTRLRVEARSVFVEGASISDVARLDVAEGDAWLRRLRLEGSTLALANPLLKAARTRLAFLGEVGLSYLTLDRAAATLSGGEAERVHLAGEMGAGLTGLIYLLDEPTVGLHPRDVAALIATLKRLRDAGNTVIVVEHDLDAVRAADHVVELGPGAGVAGGRIIAAGPSAAVLTNEASLTAAYATGRAIIPRPEAPRSVHHKITLTGVSTHNLKSVTASFPLGAWTTVTGVSGSGKSSLALQTLARIAAAHVRAENATHLAVTRATGLEVIERVVVVDQRPIGRTPRANPATYTGLFAPLRELYAATPDARARGYDAGRFSFNVKGGRCEACEGNGVVALSANVFPGAYVTCDVCAGTRYNRDTLDIRYRGRSIADALALSIEEASTVFAAVPALYERLATLVEVGLGYLQLGQPANTLSNGEAERLRLATELSRRATGTTLFVFDEPTTGLHAADVERLVLLLHRLVDRGNTIVVVEHDVDMVKQSDWVIDLGPGGGPLGGEVIFEGRPADLARCEKSATAQYLAEKM